MTNLKRHALVGASALIMGVAALATTASATEVNVYGGGSSLVAPYVRQAMDCYGDKTDLIFFGTPPTTQTEPDFNYTGSPAYNCATSQILAGHTVNYISTGSGTGINGLFSHDSTFWGDTNPGTDGNQYYPSVQYAMSDNPLGSSDVNIYNNGGTEGSVTVVAPGVTPGTGQYGNPAEHYGALVQVPNTIDPVALTYASVYKKIRNGDGSITTYSFHIRNARADGSGGLRLDRTAYCRIFNGDITNWNDPYLKTLNSNQSLKDPSDPTPGYQWSVPMQIVGREDKSGTTSIFTRHMANVCAGVTYNHVSNQFDDSHSLLPSALGGGSGSVGSGSAGNYDKTQVNTAAPGETLGKFTIANGSDGVAKYVAFTSDPGTNPGDTITQGRIAYVGPDYVLPAVLNTGANTYGLNSATLKNGQGQWIAPTAHTASLAFGSLQPPQSNADGTYNEGNTANGLRSDPSAWVQAPSKTAALADPTASGAYPMVGTTQLDTYTCFASSKSTALMKGYLSWFMNSATVENGTLGLLAEAGLSPLPPAWRKAILQTFVQDPNGIGLNFGTAGSGHCTGTNLVGG